MSAKVLDPAFHGVGQRVGTEIWRIENFLPVAIPKSEHGKFYSGDSYIVLQTSSKGTGFLYDLHFWLGKDTSQDEAGTAAIKSVELDTALGGRAVQHREVQGHESDKFLSYFRPCIIPLEGGFASGFKKVDEEAYESRLFTCRGKRLVKMKQVPFARSSLNHDDVFILDTTTKIYQFNGSNSSIQERAKALEVVQFLKDTYHHGTCEVAIVDDGKLDTESDSGAFWVLFGGFAPLSRKVASEDDVVPERSSPKLFSVSEGEVKVLECELAKGNLDNNKCYLLDCGDEIYVWIGRVTQLEEKKSAIMAAEDFIAKQNRHKSVRITRVNQGYESNSFKSNFSSWPAGSVAPGAEEGRGKVAALLKQQGVGLKGGSKNVTVNEEVPPLLEAGGKIEVWQVNGKTKIPVSKENSGKFYSGDCYIILYTYHLGDKKEEYFLCYWIGGDSVEADREAASRLANTTFNSLKGRPVLGRIFQGKEPPQFIALFPHMIILKGGLSSGYKDHVTKNSLQDETYSPECNALFCVSGTSAHNNKVLQVETSATSLNSSDCFLLQCGSSMFSWHGNQSSFEQHQLAAKVAEFLKPGVTLKLSKEGTESSSFWNPLGGKQSIGSKKTPPEVVRDPHLYTFSLNQDDIVGKFEFDINNDLRVEEVYNFSQDDLLPEDILILNTQAEVFVWIGQCVDSNEKQNAFSIGQKFIEKATSVESISSQVPLYKVTEGNEPVFFTTFFSWDPVKASVQGNSLHKKMALLFGTSHQVEEEKSNGQGGPTQRASAMAALTSAFNSSGGKSASPERSNGSNQGGPTQRASALAALNSAFNSPPDSKTTHRRLIGSGQGSQRAAAVAALSSVLTAEQKTPESDKNKSTPARTPEPDPKIPETPDTDKIERSPSPSPSESSITGDSKADFPSSKSDTSDVTERAEEPECTEDSTPVQVSSENDGKDETSPKAISYDQLKAHSDNPVTGIDFKRREAYLSDEEFLKIFGSSKDAFYKLPKWKQDLLKRKFDLF